MKIREYSDTHLDWYADAAFHQTRLIDPLNPLDPKARPSPMWYPPVLPDDKETTLILAGDLWTGTNFIEYFGYSWISDVAQQFKQVLIVLGNHDFWPVNHSLSILGGAKKCNTMLLDRGILNVKVLDMDTYSDGDVLFVGATLWTDIDKADPLAMHNMSNFMRYDGKIAFSTGPNGAWERFTSEKWVQLHYKHRDYINLVARQNPDKKIVVITHHLPLMCIGDPRYQGSTANSYYMSDLSKLILDNENITHWFCGHSHVTNDLMFPPYAENNGCRIYMNPVGYVSEHREQEGMVKHQVIEI